MNNVNNVFETFLNERIKENKRLFTEDELQYAKIHKCFVRKIYLLGFINSKDCYKNYQG